MSSNTKHICHVCSKEIQSGAEPCAVCKKPTHKTCGEMIHIIQDFAFGGEVVGDEQFVCLRDAVVPLKKYVSKLKIYVSQLKKSNVELNASNQELKDIIANALITKETKDLIDKRKQQSIETNKRIAKLESSLKNLQNNGELQNSPSKSKKHSPEVVMQACAYLLVLGLIVAVTGYLARLGWVQTPEVSIEYNLGEIIGALLVGIGAAAAGIAYAFNLLRPPPEGQRSSGSEPESPLGGGTRAAQTGDGETAEQ